MQSQRRRPSLVNGSVGFRDRRFEAELIPEVDNLAILLGPDIFRFPAVGTPALSQLAEALRHELKFKPAAENTTAHQQRINYCSPFRASTDKNASKSQIAEAIASAQCV